MARRRKSQADNSDAIARLILGLAILLACTMGSQVFVALGLIFLGILVIGGLVVLWGYLQKKSSAPLTISSVPPVPQPVSAGYSVSVCPPDIPSAKVWDSESVLDALGKIDWYQFEKFCAALLRSEGYEVERKGGAHPDGGVDLIATRDGRTCLVQCKHWKTWDIKEGVVREMLGSMTHFQVTEGAIYTLRGWTKPAAEFALQHLIAMVDGKQLAARAASALSKDVLDEVLDCSVHHCPKCESPMVMRTGSFIPFWGCPRYPRCRGVLRQSGAR